MKQSRTATTHLYTSNHLEHIIDQNTSGSTMSRQCHAMLEKYAMIIIYFGTLIFLGYLASRRVKNMNDFVIGGKSLSFWVAAFSA
jgi:hypothetical protein